MVIVVGFVIEIIEIKRNKLVEEMLFDMSFVLVFIVCESCLCCIWLLKDCLKEMSYFYLFFGSR